MKAASEQGLGEPKVASNAETKSAVSAVAASASAEASASQAGEVTPEKVKFNPEKHVMLEDAKKDNPDIKPGDEIKIELEEKQDFGRIDPAPALS